jgi:ATPase complex subunit ATP10
MLARNLAEREKLTKEFNKSYFQDFVNLGVRNGKFYMANERLFKQSAALYFPNLNGTRVVKADTQGGAQDLAMGGKGNTTEVLEGKISVVSLFSRKWALDQTHTFVSPRHNPELVAAIQQSKGTAQLVEVNFEGQMLYKMVRWLFSNTPSVVQDQAVKDVYFNIDALSQDVKEALWIMNEQVGYVFLVDQECRIRWVACGDAEEVERAALVKGLKKLIDESTAAPKTQDSPR